MASHRFTRKDSHDLVWSEPMIKLAARYGISGNGLAKDGTCVDPRLAAASRRNGILMNQVKISEIALPVPPTHNQSILRAGEFNKFELGQGGNFSTFPPSP